MFTSEPALRAEDWTDGDPSTSSLPVPVRGARPRNRRELALVAAADLFHERSYPNVSMADIAEQVGMGPSALYRHFSSKQDVLRIVLVGTLEALLADVESDPRPLPQVIGRIGVSYRRSGLLLRRELPYLDPANRATAEALRIRLQAAVARRVAAARPELDPPRVELVTIALLSTGWSRSYVPSDPDADRATSQLSAACARVLGAPVEVSAPGRAAPRPGLRSRRETVLRTATRLFAEHGYAAVSMAEVCTDAGISTATAYQLLGTKAEILATLCHRGAEELLRTLGAAVPEGATPDDAARAALEGLVGFVLAHPDLAAVLGIEASHLSPDQQRALAAAQGAYLEEWDLLLDHHRTARGDRMIRVAALLTVLIELARSAPQRAVADLTPALTSLGAALLDLPTPS